MARHDIKELLVIQYSFNTLLSLFQSSKIRNPSELLNFSLMFVKMMFLSVRGLTVSHFTKEHSKEEPTVLSLMMKLNYSLSNEVKWELLFFQHVTSVHASFLVTPLWVVCSMNHIWKRWTKKQTNKKCYMGRQLQSAITLKRLLLNKSLPLIVWIVES